MSRRGGFAVGETEGLDPEQWVDQHGDVLYRYALLRVRQSEPAAELVQETFLDALSAREHYSGRSSERTWLIGILKHKLADHYRHQARDRPEAGDSLVPAGTGEGNFDRRGHWVAGPLPWEGEPSEDLERREFWEELGRCLERLPPHLADPFLFSELDGLGGDEICQILRISPANLWARLHRARLLLRGCLERRWLRGEVRRPHATHVARTRNRP
jgi:RNA polymerase sigma-70 factor (ECF subfamily)